MSTMIQVTKYEKDKVLVKLNGVSVVPEFKELNGRRVPDDSKKPFTVVEHGKYGIGKFKVQAELTGTQKLTLFDQKEKPDGKITIYLSVFDKFQKEAGLKLENNDKVDILISDLAVSEKGYYSAVCMYLQKTDRYVKMPYQYAWAKKISEKDIGRSIITANVKFQRPEVKNEDGSYSKSDSEPYFNVQTFSNGTEYANVKSLVSLHYKTATKVFGENDERVQNKTGQYVTYFPSLMATNRVLKQLKGLGEKYMDRSFIADMMLEKNDKYYNGQMFSLAFTKKAKSEDEDQKESDENKVDVPDFPTIPAEATEDTNETTQDTTEVATPEFPTIDNEQEETVAEEETPFDEGDMLTEEDEPMPDFSALGM